MTRIALFALLVLVLFVLCRFLMTLIDPALATSTETTGSADAATAQLGQQRALANAIPPFLLAIFLIVLTRRPLLSLWVTFLLVIVLYRIDQLKFDVLRSHLLPADFSLLAQIIDSPGLYLSYLQVGATGWIAIIAGIGFTAALVRFEPVQRWLRPWLRTATAVLALVSAGLLITMRAPFDTWYSNETIGFQPWEPDSSVERAGLIASLVKLGGETAWKVPEPDPAVVHEVLDQIGNTPSPLPPVPTAALPDIIIWQSESLFDTARFQAIKRGSQQPSLERIRTHSLHGEMLVPAFGGGTVRTEFETMTGFPMRAFPNVNYPYSALAQKPLMALPRALRELGYRTIAIHPYERGFWSRNTAFAHLGFDAFVDQTSFDHANDRHGIYIGDQALLRHVEAALDETGADDPPLFVFAISMENHGPWNNDRRLPEHALDDIAAPDGLPEQASLSLRNYLYHVRRADRFLEELVTFAAQRERHTLVLFYGDHLPGLSDVFETMAFRDGASATEQPVPFLLFDNRGDNHAKLDANLHSYHLASLLLDSIGLRINEHFRLLSADRERTSPTGLGDTLTLERTDPEQALLNLSWHFYQQGVDTGTRIGPAAEPPP